jgi:hypothetical protein
MKLAISVLLLLAGTCFPQTLTTTIASAETYLANPYDMLVIVTRYPPGQCDLTCTTVSYTFCKNEVPGCQEGWYEIPDRFFTGDVGPNWLTTTRNVILNTAVLVSNEAGYAGESWLCYSWDDNGNCSDEKPLTIPSGSDGWISITWHKALVEAQIQSVTTYVPGTTSQQIIGKFTADSTGTVFEVPIATNGTCCLAYTQSISKTNTVASVVLADKLSEPSLRRLRAIERAQKAAIAARAK